MNVEAKFICKNIVSEGQGKEKYELIIDSFFLHCIIGKDRTKVIKKLSAILQNNGEIWINTMCNPPKNSDVPYNQETKCMEVKFEDRIVSTRYFTTPKELKELMLENGFILKKEFILVDTNQDNYLGIYTLG